MLWRQGIHGAKSGIHIKIEFFLTFLNTPPQNYIQKLAQLISRLGSSLLHRTPQVNVAVLEVRQWERLRHRHSLPRASQAGQESLLTGEAACPSDRAAPALLCPSPATAMRPAEPAHRLLTAESCPQQAARGRPGSTATAAPRDLALPWPDGE